MTSFEVKTPDEHVIGLDDAGVMWFNACCDGDRVQLDVKQAIQLRNVVNVFLSKNGIHRS